LNFLQIKAHKVGKVLLDQQDRQVLLDPQEPRAQHLQFQDQQVLQDLLALQDPQALLVQQELLLQFQVLQDLQVQQELQDQQVLQALLLLSQAQRVLRDPQEQLALQGHREP
jgi:hypothetical protein